MKLNISGAFLLVTRLDFEKEVAKFTLLKGQSIREVDAGGEDGTSFTILVGNVSVNLSGKELIGSTKGDDVD